MAPFLLMFKVITSATLLFSIDAHVIQEDRGLRCRCMPSQTCWPQAAEWKIFNSSVEGALIASEPLASPCHDPFYDPEACNSIKRNWNDPFWRAQQPSALQAPNYEMYGSHGCLLQTPKEAPCCKGALPEYIVQVSKAAHVQKTILFAAKHDLRLAIKNTGHEMTGRNTAAGALSLWMHHLKGITFFDNFVPCKNSSSLDNLLPRKRISAVKVAAGVQWEELYEAAHRHGKTVVGAQCSSVGAAGGYPQGGGHSQISPSFGLAADNVLEYEVVTANGKLMVANACHNQHLFWALRGGGGGTYGVVTYVTYATYPALRSLVFASYFISASNSSAFKEFLAEFLLMSPSLANVGWGGTFLLGNNKSLVIQYLLPNKDTRLANKTIVNHLVTCKSKFDLTLSGGLQVFHSYYEWHRAVHCSREGKCGYPSGFTTLEASRLIPRVTIQSSSLQLASALIKIQEAGYPRVSGYLVGGGKVSLPHLNAVNPAWRNATLHILVAGFYPEFSTVEAKISMETMLTNTMKMLIDLTSGSGSYMNEADSNEATWQESFFGSHYKTLKHIKDMVDPHGLFVCRHCVGSEDWSNDLNCRLQPSSSSVT